MKKHFVCGLLSLTLWGAVQAQPHFPLPLPWDGQQFVAQNADLQFILNCLNATSEKEILELSTANPERTRRCFQGLLEVVQATKPQQRDPHSTGLLWFWARILDSQEMKDRLIAAKIAEAPLTLGDAYTGADLVDKMLLNMGNLRQSEKLLNAIEKSLEGIKGPVADRQTVYLAKARMVSGRYLLARQQGDALVQLAKAQPDSLELLELYVCLLDAARMGGFPEVTNRYLEPFQQTINALPAEKRPLWQFYQSSFAELRELERTPQSSVAEFCRRHDAVWAQLKEARPFANGLLGRVYRHLVSHWLNHMGNNYLLHEIPAGSPDDALLNASFALELAPLERVMSTYKPGQELNVWPEMTAALGLINDTHQELLRVGQFKLAGETIPQMVQAEKILMAAEPGIAALQKPYNENLRGTLKLKVDFSLDFLDGDWSRQRARMRLAQLQQMLAEYKGKWSAAQSQKAQKLAAEALDLNTRAMNGLGYPGADDARWVLIDYQLRVHPAGWAKEAQRLLDQLSALNQQLGYREGLARVAMLRGRLLAAQNQNAAAIESLQRAVDGVESYLTEVEAGEAGSQAIRKRYQDAYKLLAKLQLSSGKGDRAFQTVSRQLQADAVQQNQDSLRDNTQLREIQRVRAETAALEKQVADERLQGKDTKASEQLLASSKGEYQRVVADLRRSHPQYEGAMAVRPVEFLELKKSIPADATAVLYFVSDDGVYSFVASQQGDLKIHKVAVDPKELEKSAVRVRQLINLFPFDADLSAHPEAFRWNDPASPGFQRQSLPLKTELARLNKWLIDPIREDLCNRPVLAIVPTGVLHYVPFPALCSLDATGNPKFLAEKYQCVNLVKTSDLVPLPGSAPGKKLFAVGNPDGSLPGAEREVESITASFPQSQKVIGKEATAARLKKLAPDTGYVHLATHGQLSEADPKNSYLVMAGSGDSAHFRATDIYDLDWQGVRLVTLSACKTALQEGKPGAAITSLAEAFRVAGGHSVVASLWSVEDNATERLMIEFYKQLAQGKTLAASLQSAELSLAAQPKYSHPFFWASFTLFGDWR